METVDQERRALCTHARTIGSRRSGCIEKRSYAYLYRIYKESIERSVGDFAGIRGSTKTWQHANLQSQKNAFVVK